MLFPLPADTVVEAKARTRRNTAILLVALFIIYTVFFNLLAWVLLVLSKVQEYPSVIEVTLNSTLAAILVAIIHYLVARSRSLDRILKELRAIPADPNDDRHRVFTNIIGEAEAATGIRPIRAVIIPTPALNAFSIMDGSEHAAIGITEGLLAKLDRAELSAVIAHEAAHLAHGDSQLIATACSMFSIFDTMDAFMSRADSKDRQTTSGFYPTRIRIRGRSGGGYLLVLLVVKTGHFLTRLLYMAISRNREHLADADAVHICKDPMALAEALYKISQGDRGGSWMAGGYAAVFILNPLYTHLDEDRGFVANLLSTHPPVKERLENLLNWAKSDLLTLVNNINSDAKKTEAAKVEDLQKLMVHKNGQWQGPMNPQDLITGGLITPLSPVMGPQELQRASDIPELQAHFDQEMKQKYTAEQLSQHVCPRCRVLLVKDLYEGVPIHRCVHCGGCLLTKVALDRIVIRKEYRFDATQIAETKKWRALQIGTIKNLCQFPAITCPLCGDSMAKLVHSELTRVVVDRCMNEKCHSMWLDAGEIEKMQILVEEVSRLN